MKKLTWLLLMLAIGISTVCQQIPPANLKIQKEQYLHKSKVQKTWAWITLGAGAAIIIATAVGSSSDSKNTNGWFSMDGLEKTLNAYSYATGAAVTVASVLLFEAAARNKRKAAQLSVFMRTEKVPEFGQGGYAIRIVPVAGIKILLK
jgi:hypothetical protein